MRASVVQLVAVSPSLQFPGPRYPHPPLLFVLYAVAHAEFPPAPHFLARLTAVFTELEHTWKVLPTVMLLAGVASR